MICAECRKLVTKTDSYCRHCGSKAYPKKEFEVPYFDQKNEEETTIGWLKNEFKTSLKTAPQKLIMIGVFSLVIILVNVVFWWLLKPSFLPFPLNLLVNLIVFLTATYNNIIPKTIYWVLLFTFYRRLAIQVIRKGIPRTFGHMKSLIPTVKKAIQHMPHITYSLLLAGGGLGLVIANNFASYSRFSSARNKLDKYFVVLVICFAILYSLNRSMNKVFLSLSNYLCMI